MELKILTSQFLKAFSKNGFSFRKLGKSNGCSVGKNYFEKLNDYYSNHKKLGLEYEALDYGKSLDFLLMTASAFDEEK